MNPSFQEGLPTTVMEALVSGCQVIATDVGGTREILRKIPFALIEPRNTEALEAALLRSIYHSSSVLQDENIIQFLWENTFREFREVYHLI